MTDIPRTHDEDSSPTTGEEVFDDDAHDAVIVEIPQVEATAEMLGLTLPGDPDDAQRLLLRELQEARQESGDLLANLQRVTAEFDNYRKRVERDQVENVLRAGQRVIQKLLPALDSFDAALASEATTEGEQRMLEGMKSTYDQLLEALSGEGFELIEAIGEPFDPALHEAVSVTPGDGEQVVDQELRKGYVMRGRVIRPSLVIVGHA
ncbi:MAG: nucleotide exchange factor GrpE [Actinomycetia bacterium]|nr:nucleotide exchange factor GrpE [Actinomycetes bacterium]